MVSFEYRKHIIFWSVLRCPSGPGSFLYQGEIMGDKIFRTYDEQIELLKNRGVDINDTNINDAKKYLADIGYYNLINGYKDLFLESTEPEDKYIKGTTLNDIHALYHFDSRLRESFLRMILDIEKKVKSIMAYVFSEKYGHDNYLRLSNFSDKSNPFDIVNLIADIQKQIANRQSEPSIRHYLTKHGYIPLWVLMNVLTFGTMSKFYSLMKQEDRQAVSKQFGISEAEMESSLLYLTNIRNMAAHGNRLYCFRSRKALRDANEHIRLHIPKTDSNEYKYAKRDLFAALVSIKPLLDKFQFSMEIRLLKTEIDTFVYSTDVVSENDLLESMGFPDNWIQISNEL